MKNFIGFLLVIILMSSCSEYQKLLKSGDSQAMYKKAVEYYNNGDYTKASNLFDGIRMVFQGTSKAQSVAYYRAFCSYNQKDYEVAAELFKQFVSIYPEITIPDHVQTFFHVRTFRINRNELFE